MTAPAVPTALVQRLAELLQTHHAGHVVAPLVTALGPHLRPATTDGPAAEHVDIRLVAQLVGLLGRDRADLLPQILHSARPWLHAPGAAVVGRRGGLHPVDDHTVVLSEREMQVLRGLSLGRSNGEIGRDLFISEDTVKSHARSLFRKLGARDRAHAVRRGFELGLLTPGTPASSPVQAAS